MSVQGLRDAQDVRDRVFAYAHAVDRRRLDLVVDCFTHDCAYEGALGSGTIADALQTLAAAFGRYTATMHFMGTQEVRCDGHSARATTYCVAYHVRPDGRHFTVGVRYHDELVRMADAWRIRRRTVRTDWTRDQPASAVA